MNNGIRARIVIAAACCVCGALPAAAQQQMGDFSLSGFGDKGKKNWDLAGKQADIVADVVKLNDVQSNLYTDEQTIRLTAQRGDFDRKGGNIHLEKDVVVTTSTGTRLTTESLDWDRAKQLVWTREPVAIDKDDIRIDAVGAHARQDLNTLKLEKEVAVQIREPAPAGDAAPAGGPMEIVCDGPLEIDYQNDRATFTNNVRVTTADTVIESAVLTVYFTSSAGKQAADIAAASFAGSRIAQLVASGNVKITKGEHVSYSDQAVYTVADKKITLSGRPRLVIADTQGTPHALTGD